MLNVRTIFFCAALLASILSAAAATARIKKVLPHYLDKEGRHTLAPSLYERDAYQAHLRRNPEERGALRFDVHWKLRGLLSQPLKLRLELRGGDADRPQTVVVEQPVKPSGLFNHWTSIKLSESDFAKTGDLAAWRATLWEGEQMIAEQKSFLW